MAVTASSDEALTKECTNHIHCTNTYKTGTQCLSTPPSFLRRIRDPVPASPFVLLSVLPSSLYLFRYRYADTSFPSTSFDTATIYEDFSLSPRAPKELAEK